MICGSGSMLARLRVLAGLRVKEQRQLSPSLRIAAALVAAESWLMGTLGVAAVGVLAQARSGCEIAAVMVAIGASLAVALLHGWGQSGLEQLAGPRSVLVPAAWSILVGAGLSVLVIEIAGSASLELRRWTATGWTIVGVVVVLLHRAAVRLRWQAVKGYLGRRLADLACLGAVGVRLAQLRAFPRGPSCHLHLLGPGAPHAAQAHAAAILRRRAGAVESEDILVVALSQFEGGADAALLAPSPPSDGSFAGRRHLPFPTRFACLLRSNRGGLLFATVNEPTQARIERISKRIFDLLAASVLLILGLPVFALIALLIKLDSRGPVLFRQQRRGLHNEVFEMLKFRSMREDLCDPLAQRLTSRDDPRVTRIGAFLRRWSLDELPQLLNVLEGTMSLVGPRPHPLQAKAGKRLYEEVVADFALRYGVRPGITGWAQVNGLRGNTDSEEKLVRRFAYDMAYIRHWSLWLDLRIVLQTPGVIILRENAY